MINQLKGKISKIKCLVTDVDGVLTNGRIYVDEASERVKSFHVHDGQGIKIMLKAGFKFAVISVNTSSIIQTRLNKLGVTDHYLGYENKLEALNKFMQKYSLAPEQIAYMGDDLPDIPVLKTVGLAIAVANANKHVLSYADYQTRANGGNGAVREVCDYILQTQNLLKPILEQFIL
ncbi:MAG: HAD-IIIA family hydrolase [Pseudomonadota bacterium]